MAMRASGRRRKSARHFRCARERERAEATVRRRWGQLPLLFCIAAEARRGVRREAGQREKSISGT